MSFAGLAPVMALAEQARLSELISGMASIEATRVQSAGTNPAGKITSIVAGMAAGADSIDDLDLVRSGGMPRLFAGVYAPATPGQFLLEFTQGHGLQLASVARAHLVSLAQRTDLLPGIEQQAFIDVDRCCARSTGTPSRAPASGTPRSPAGRCCAKACRRRPPRSAPSMARRWWPGSGCGPGRQAPARARRRWCARRVVAACIKARVRFWVVLAKNAAVNAAIGAIPDDAWTPVHCPGAVLDPGTGELISDAEVAQTTLTAFASTQHPVTARLVVRRVRDRTKTEET